MTDPSPASQLVDQRILISGGTSGIGYAVARHLAPRNRVWVLGSRQATVETTVAELPVAGGTGCDVADETAVRQAFDEATSTLGGLDGAFVNAGIDGQARPGVDLEVEPFRRLLDVNVIGAFLVARAAVAAMGGGPGSIVFNASLNAMRPEKEFLDYNASKAAVVSMAKTMAMELREVAVIALCPGYFPTPMTEPYLSDPQSREEFLGQVPAGRFGRLEEIGPVVEFLLSPAARYLTGGTITLDGGAGI